MASDIANTRHLVNSCERKLAMKTYLLIFTTVLLFACQQETKQEPAQEKAPFQEITLQTPDSIQLFGDLYEIDKAGPTILLFHQGGSNARGEYAPIIPKLTAKGFNILAIDLRVGGQYYGQYNRTIANIPSYSFGDKYGYCDAYNNLESALDYMIVAGFTGKKIAWGSSYSASLAVQLGNKRPDDLVGVLAFSPAAGGPLEACSPNPYFETITVPLLVLRPPNEMENESSQAQFALAEEHGHQTFVPKHGRHGSSMLVEERVGHNTDATWEVVMAFIDKVSR